MDIKEELMKNYVLSFIFFTMLLMTPIHADVIGNPLIWMLYSPPFLIMLIVGVCLVSVLLRKILTKKGEDQ